MRGAIAVALVYYYFDPRGMADDSHRSTIIATTLIVVLFSTVVFSAATKPLLDFMLGAGRTQNRVCYTSVSVCSYVTVCTFTISIWQLVTVHQFVSM